MLDQAPPRIFETQYIGTRYLAGKCAPNVQRFNTPNEANSWAAEHEPVRIFAWDEPVPESYNGFAIEEQRFLRGEYGNRSRVWAMPSDMADPKPEVPSSKPIETLRPSFTATSYEIRVRQNGILLPLAAEHCDTLSQAQESAAHRCRAMGLAEYFEVTANELKNLDQDGVYLAIVETTRHAVAV